MADGDVKTYPGEEVDILWDSRLCIHVGECGRASNDVFVAGRKPWGDPNRGSAAESTDTCQRCPTGALSYLRKDNGLAEQADPTNTVVVANNGPLYFRGQLEVDGATDDMPGVQFRAALCRCGQSANKPFCDNSHETSGFVDRGAVGQSGESLEKTGGPLSIKRAANGPLLVSGNLELVAASGRVAWRGTKAALCRCGASKNKPFCDGSHKAAGFEAD